jgi:hypothetical protein
MGGYHVSGAEAVRLLRERDPEAAEWWERNAPYVLDNELVFAREVCELLE